MISQSVVISSSGIKRIRKYNWTQAISEYIWNGFDAGATSVTIEFKQNKDNEEFDTFSSIFIKDNGCGINYEELGIKFGKVFESLKNSIKTDKQSLIQGKNGYGRFTFYAFARNAKWLTNYKKDDKFFEYDIIINRDSLQSYSTSDKRESEGNSSFTVIEFTEIDPCINIDTVKMN